MQVGFSFDFRFSVLALNPKPFQRGQRAWKGLECRDFGFGMPFLAPGNACLHPKP